MARCLKDWSHDAAWRAFEALDVARGADAPALDQLPAVFVGGASAKDASWAERHPGKAAVTVLAPVSAAWFDAWRETKHKNRGAEYDAFKARGMNCFCTPAQWGVGGRARDMTYPPRSCLTLGTL